VTYRLRIRFKNDQVVVPSWRFATQQEAMSAGRDEWNRDPQIAAVRVEDEEGNSSPLDIDRYGP
jgi:hypothetical protein